MKKYKIIVIDSNISQSVGAILQHESTKPNEFGIEFTVLKPATTIDVAEQLLRAIGQGVDDSFVVLVNVMNTDYGDAIIRIKSKWPQVRVYLLSPNKRAADLQASSKFGADGVLYYDATRILNELLSELSQEEAPKPLVPGMKPQAQTPAQIIGAFPYFSIAVFAPRGGVGKSSLTYNLSVALRKQLPSDVMILIIDCDDGNAGLSNIIKTADESKTWNNFKYIKERDMDTRAIINNLYEVPGYDNLYALLLSSDISNYFTDRQKWREVAKLLFDKLSRIFPVIIFDCAPSLASPFTLEALLAASKIILIADMREPNNSLNQIQGFAKLNADRGFFLDPAKIFVVGNFYNKKINMRQFIEALGFSFAIAIPVDLDVGYANDSGYSMIESKPRSEFSRAVMDLAKELLPVQINVPKKISWFK